MVESNTTTALYPIWIDGDKLYCDKARLKDHLTQKLNYNGNVTARIIQQIAGYKQYSLHYFWGITAGNMSTEAIRVLLHSMQHSQLIQLLIYRDEFACTPLQWCADNEKSEVIEAILDSVSETECYQLLSIGDWWEQTPLHKSCLRGDTKSVRVMLNHVNQERRYSLLRMTSNHSTNTPLHHASYNGHSDVIKVVNESVTQTQWINLLQMKGREDMKVLHTAAYRDKQSCMDSIRGSVSDEEWILLLSSLPEYNHFVDDEENYQRAVSMVDELRAAARVKSVLLTQDKSERKLQIQEITETESLTTEQIQQLSPHSSQYIIPHKQKKTRRYGLIFFRSEGRQGAVEEADDLEHALRATGCEVIKMEWSVATELHNMIESALSRIVANCSLLIVGLMSHGSRGALADSHGQRIPVNNIIHQFSIRLSQAIPLVMLIQACQEADRALVSQATGGGTSEPDPAPTQRSDPRRDQHITLTRPNTVLLLATVRGGVAYRGVFTGAMADQFRSADGKKDINAMFVLAAELTRQRNVGLPGAEQIPKLESTTHKFLVLPPVEMQRTSDKQ